MTWHYFYLLNLTRQMGRLPTCILTTSTSPVGDVLLFGDANLNRNAFPHLVTTQPPQVKDVLGKLSLFSLLIK